MLVALATIVAAPLTAQQHVDTDTVRAGRYDLGRMWTFEYPPVEEFRRYGFTPDSAWFARARLAALRLPGCSAAFVSADGLIVTNHHCVRSRVAAVSGPGETLLDSGFVAKSIADERPIPGYYADQLIAVQDVSGEIENAMAAAETRADRSRIRAVLDSAQADASQAIRQRLAARHARSGDSIWVQIVPLYSGARHSAYVFRRYTDIRLVVAAELQIGFFGGDWDNFTFPRYDLDFAVLRAYDGSGRPQQTPHYFTWGGMTGVREGDVVFVIGNPGQTSRLTTMSQLEWARDVAAPVQLAFLTSRHRAMDEYRATGGAEAERYDIRNRMFSLSNVIKSLGGRIEALNDPVIMARRADAERALRDSIARRPSRSESYGQLFARMAAHQDMKRRDEQAFRAFAWAMSASGGSSTFQRAYLAWRAAQSADSAEGYRQRLARVASVPAPLERRLLALQLGDIERAYGAAHPMVRTVLAGNPPDAAAGRLLGGTALGDTAAARRAGLGELRADPMMQLMNVLGPVLMEHQRTQAVIATSEAGLASYIGRVRWEIYGPAVPPDGSSSPRIADGVVRGYEYNGTWAAPFTTFFGMYDRFHANGPGTAWDLPLRWRTPPAGLELATPLNFVSTADTYGGNSGSPAVTKDLRIVGLNFDRNINALVRDYIYLPERGRNVMVDMRAVQEALEHAYDAGRVARELVAGRRQP